MSRRRVVEVPLRTWKEIAAYLDITTRTAVKLPKRGLRVKYDPFGRVFVAPSVVDAWREKASRARGSDAV